MHCASFRHVGELRSLRQRGSEPLVRNSSLCLRRRHRRVVDGDSSQPKNVVAASAAAEAVYAALSVAATSATIALGSLNSNRGGKEDGLAPSTTLSDGASSILSPLSSSSSPLSLLLSAPAITTRATATATPRSRPLYVSLSIASFLPYFNFAAFAALAAVEKMKEMKKQRKNSVSSSSSPQPLSLLQDLLTSSPAALVAFAAFYAAPFAFASGAAEGGDEGHAAALAVESLVLGIFHFQAIRAAGERREEEEEIEEAEAEREGEEAFSDENGAASRTTAAAAAAPPFASLAAAELERFDARLGLKTAKVSRLKELAEGAGLIQRGGGGRRRRGGDGGKEGGVVVGGVSGGGSVDVARNKASLAAALAAAATLDGGRSESRDDEEGGGKGMTSFAPSATTTLDLETREWLTSELAKEASALLEASKKKKRRSRAGGASATARALEALEEEQEKL